MFFTFRSNNNAFVTYNNALPHFSLKTKLARRYVIDNPEISSIIYLKDEIRIDSKSRKYFENSIFNEIASYIVFVSIRDISFLLCIKSIHLSASWLLNRTKFFYYFQRCCRFTLLRYKYGYSMHFDMKFQVMICLIVYRRCPNSLTVMFIWY